MDNHQIRIFKFALIAVALASIYVPWEYTFDGTNGTLKYDLGYGFLWAPPEVSADTSNISYLKEISLDRWFAQILIFVSFTVGLLYQQKDSK